MECTYKSEEAFRIEGRGYVLPGMIKRGWPLVGMALDSDPLIKVREVEYILTDAPREKLGVIVDKTGGDTIALPPGEHVFRCSDSPENVGVVRSLLDRALRYAESVLRDKHLKNLMCSYETSPALADAVSSLRGRIAEDDVMRELFGIFGPTGHWDDLGAPSLPANEVCELLCMLRDAQKSTGEQGGGGQAATRSESI